MKSAEAVEIISRECTFIDDWISQGKFPDETGKAAIKDREITRCLRNLREAALYAPEHESERVTGIVALAEKRLNSAR